MRNLVFAECECSREGVLCDKTTGACSCKAGWFGELCQGKLKLITSEHMNFVCSMSG